MKKSFLTDPSKILEVKKGRDGSFLAAFLSVNEIEVNRHFENYVIMSKELFKKQAKGNLRRDRPDLRSSPHKIAQKKKGCQALIHKE